MFSSSGALRALSVAALFSSVLSLPHLPGRPAKRSLQDYVDHLVYLDANNSALYAAIEIGGQTYGVHLDSQWGGLVVKNGSLQGTTTQITVEGVAVAVTEGNGTVRFLQEDVDVGFYSTSQWPSSWPSIGSSAGVGAGKLGIDITDSTSVVNQYLAAKSSDILNNWYYDLLIFYDWQTASFTTGDLEFAGIIAAGSPLDWASVFDISASDATSYGLPDLSSIKDQPYIYLRSDGTFYVDDGFWANGKLYSCMSGVPQTPSSSVVVEVSLTQRFSTFPDAVVNGLYSSLSGAKYYGHSNYGYYQVPCDVDVEFYFTIGGVKYNVTQDALVAPNPWGDQCIGALFTKGQGSASTTSDVVFGFQFLSAFYYRAGIDHSANNQPYVKMLPLPGSHSWAASSGAWPWSGSGSQYSGSAAPVSTQYTPSTSTIFATTTHTVIGTVTLPWPTSSAASSASGSYSGSSSGSGASSNAGYSDSGYNSESEDMAVAGNAAETDADGNDLNSPRGSSSDNLTRLLPAIIVMPAVLGLGLVIGLVVCLVRRRRGPGAARGGPSAYSNIYELRTHGPVHVPLYGADAGTSRYSDPYKDKE
ncbi:uncharacterized protein TRAVEDRAFT_20285 [Trametes versicolor FP-101664 SS1]|uniref:uncharacterized protein n=1 Tax=Trametes versicolor (strain FP-101664) TaxID=717944 RepID=UPI00046238BA|nr:uncharacterized protein TRAVEDRAFT_20285 [Trametes versicolor FP-101664 SS1]EIW58201.1 hypothetical protein TRAVEDRAFT_20285 [Trametes versicolor FP-101664 SS1]